jgi:membrane-associated protease RseP (regulator of RpoE activity)
MKMDMDTHSGNGHSYFPVEILDRQFPPRYDFSPVAPQRRPLWPALVLFALTVLSTLAVGSEYASSYALNQEPFSNGGDSFSTVLLAIHNPRLILLGLPFSLTLLGILLTHELGHYFASKIYGIDVSYPYFIPAPTLFGTFGAFIKIRSPITTRRALFDIGIAGPVAGFAIALPAMAYAIASSKIIPGIEDSAAIVFGTPPLMKIFLYLFHPHADPSSLLLNPVGRAAWMGLFATALNLLPIWQLDGGHIVFSLWDRNHQRISLVLAAITLAMGRLSPVWYLWGGLLFILCLRFRHPPLLDPWQPLGASRKLWAVAALVIFLLCFTPWPAR